MQWRARFLHREIGGVDGAEPIGVHDAAASFEAPNATISSNAFSRHVTRRVGSGTAVRSDNTLMHAVSRCDSNVTDTAAPVGGANAHMRSMLAPPTNAGCSQPGHVDGIDVDVLEHRSEQRRHNGRRQSIQNSSEHVGEADSRLGSPPTGDIAGEPGTSDGIGIVDREHESCRRESVPAGRVVLRPQADRHRDPQCRDLVTEQRVEVVEATSETGQENVVDRSAREPGR